MMIENKGMCAALICGLSLCLGACEAPQVNELVPVLEFIPTAELIVVERRAPDGELFDVHLRYNDEARVHLDAFIDDLEVLPRADMERAIGVIEAADGRFVVGEVPVLPAFFVTLKARGAQDVSDYVYRSSLLLDVPADPSGAKEGASAPVGLALIRCRAAILEAASVPFVHLMELRTDDDSSLAKLNPGIDQIALTSPGPRTYAGLVENAFYDEPFVVEISMSCLP